MGSFSQLKALALATLCGGLLIAACGSSAEQPTYVQPKDEGEPDGKAVYMDKCNVCHGPDGKRGVSGASDLSVSKMTMDQRIGIITYGKNTMVGWHGILTAKEIEAVAQYVEALRVPAEN